MRNIYDDFADATIILEEMDKLDPLLAISVACEAIERTAKRMNKSKIDLAIAILLAIGSVPEVKE